MKKLLNLIIILFLLTICGCQTETGINKTIEIKEMRNIAELATVECYFHNVAKSNQELNPAWFQFWEKKNMRFWIEYDGIVKIGIDAADLKIEVVDSLIKITLPEAKVLESKVNEKTLNEDSFYFDPDTKKPTGDEQNEALAKAQEYMEETAKNNKTLMVNARENAKELLENYVNSIGELTGVEYSIEWIYAEDAESATSSNPDNSGQ